MFLTKKFSILDFLFDQSMAVEKGFKFHNMIIFQKKLN